MLKTALFSIALISLLSAQALAQTSTQITISSDRQSYHANDTITISGKISPAPQASTAILQVFNTFNVLIQIGVIHVSQDGSFTGTVKAQGAGWQNNGTYTIKALYVSPPINAVAATTVTFNTSSGNAVLPANPPASQSQAQASPANQSPSIPQTSTIPPQQAVQVPFWAKDTARKWHDGLASNTEFGKVIQYMISSGLVKTSHTITPQNSFDNAPYWVKDTAGWWSQGLVPDADFAGTIQFLLNEGIIEP